MRVAIDTNRYVDFAKGLPEAVERFRRADEILVPFVVLGELRAGFAGGARTGDNEANLVRFLDSRRVDPLFAGDTVFAWSEVIAKSKSPATARATGPMRRESVCQSSPVRSISICRRRRSPTLCRFAG